MRDPPSWSNHLQTPLHWRSGLGNRKIQSTARWKGEVLRVAKTHPAASDFHRDKDPLVQRGNSFLIGWTFEVIFCSPGADQRERPPHLDIQTGTNAKISTSAFSHQGHGQVGQPAGCRWAFPEWRHCGMGETLSAPSSVPLCFLGPEMPQLSGCTLFSFLLGGGWVLIIKSNVANTESGELTLHCTTARHGASCPCQLLVCPSPSQQRPCLAPPSPGPHPGVMPALLTPPAGVPPRSSPTTFQMQLLIS